MCIQPFHMRVLSAGRRRWSDWKFQLQFHRQTKRLSAPTSVFPSKPAVEVSKKAQTIFVPISPDLGFDSRQ